MATPVAPALNPAEAILGVNNGPGLYIAPASTPGPASITAPWEEPWRPLGYASEDGITIAADVSSDSITPWQATSPIRQVITEKSYTMQFVLLQTNTLTLALYFDVGEPEANADGSFSFDIRSDEGGYVHALGLDIKDGERIERLVFPRAQLSDNGDVTVSRGEVMGWDVTFSALDEAGVLANVMAGAVEGEAEGASAPAPASSRAPAASSASSSSSASKD